MPHHLPPHLPQCVVFPPLWCLMSSLTPDLGSLGVKTTLSMYQATPTLASPAAHPTYLPSPTILTIFSPVQETKTPGPSINNQLLSYNKDNELTNTTMLIWAIFNCGTCIKTSLCLSDMCFLIWVSVSNPLSQMLHTNTGSPSTISILKVLWNLYYSFILREGSQN